MAYESNLNDALLFASVSLALVVLALLAAVACAPRDARHARP